MSLDFVDLSSVITSLAIGLFFICVLRRACVASSRDDGGDDDKKKKKEEEKEKEKRKQYPPLVGTVFHRLLNFERLHHYHTDISRRHKTFRIWRPFNYQIFTVDPANVEHILKANFGNYGKGWYNYSNSSDLFGDGIFAVDGEKWRQQRKLASYEFSTKVLRDFSGVTFKSNAAKLANVISDYANSNKEMDIQDLFMKSTMDSIFKVAFGMELNSLHDSDEGSKFAKAFDDSSALIMLRGVNPLWKLMRALNIGSEAKLKKNLQVVDDFVYKLMHNRIEEMSTFEFDSSAKKQDILSRFLEESKKDPSKMSNKYLRDIILNFLIAGKDTTAGTLSWFFFLVCKHPHIQEKIFNEVKLALGTDGIEDFCEFSSRISDAVLDKMQYLHAALTETLRLYPAVPLDGKVCFSDDTLPDGFSVRKNDLIYYQPYAMGRMECLWGKDADIFRPERWLDDHGLFRAESPFKFTAFQAGPRICLGKEFAYRQMKIFAAVLLHSFSFKLSDETKAVNYRTMITLHINQGLHLRAFKR